MPKASALADATNRYTRPRVPSHLTHLALVALASLGLGCVHRGVGWQPEPSTEVAPDGVGVIVLGQARPGHATREVAEHLDELIARERSKGNAPIVLWLGRDHGPVGPDRAGACKPEGWAKPGLRELEQVLSEHVEAGGSVWAMPGPDDWRCGMPRQAAPLVQPDWAYLVHVHEDGRTTLASSCTEGERSDCELATPASDVLVELVFVDPSPWVYPELEQSADASRALDRLDALLIALAREPFTGPRILVSSVPIESSSIHGLGGWRQRVAHRFLPDSLRAAIDAGTFVGVISALERDLQVSDDLSGAIVRSDRDFIAAPIFQVISGAAGGARGELPAARGNTLLNQLESDHPGFARLELSRDHVRIDLHARVVGRWQLGSRVLPLAPGPAPTLREVPPIQPCLRCDPVRAAADGEPWFDRGGPPR